MKKIYKTSDVIIDYAEFISLQSGGKVKLGMSTDDANTVTTNLDMFTDRRTTISSAYGCWNFVGIAWLGYSVYLSFTQEWWWFFWGFVGQYILWSANRKGNVSNLLDLATKDEDFYETVRQHGMWLYQMEDHEAEQYRT
jgi:hypothetical protein